MRVLGLTTSRSDYGILKHFYKKIDLSSFFSFSILVTGSHHSKIFGSSYQEIKNDNFKNIINIKTNFDNNHVSHLTNSISLIYDKFSSILLKNKPDLIIMLGDRFELIPFAHLAVMHKIKILHIHGGEITDGSMDNVFRNAISAMSNFHFVSNSNSLKLLQNIYYIDDVFNIGSMAINSILKTKFLSRNAISKKINFTFAKSIFVILFHPNTISNKTDMEVRELLKSLVRYNEISLIFISPNADPGSNIIFREFTKFIKSNKNSTFIKNLNSYDFYSLVKISNLLIGNSSSGLIEIPSIGTPTINIGERQHGRLKSNSVINSNFDEKEITKSIKLGLSAYFVNKIKINNNNPYFKKNSIDLAMSYLKIISKRI